MFRFWGQLQYYTLHFETLAMLDTNVHIHVFVLYLCLRNLTRNLLKSQDTGSFLLG